jgi:NAD(P)-dependent dehydrogenase (short-subunit alcohol dehydrogenase family)
MSRGGEETTRTAIVTGSSSGIGLETSIALARNGFYTYATMRNPAKGKTLADMAEKEKLPLQVAELDVNSDESVRDTVDGIAKERKRIDVVVNNAGFALVGALEETSMDEIKTQFETNLFGALRVMKAVIPVMRRQTSGTIVNITSMGGKIAIPLDPIYHGTKFALEGITESVRYEMQPFGVNVILVEPGAVKTNFFDNLKLAQGATRPDSPYARFMGSLQSAAAHMVQDAIPAREVAEVIAQAAKSDSPQMRYVIGKDAQALIEAKKSMGDKEFEKLVASRFFGNQ